MKIIKNIKTIEDLYKLGPIDKAIDRINNELSPLSICAKDYESLMDSIKHLQRNWAPLKPEYFTTKRKEYIYYILEHDGEKREKLLGISDQIYKNAEEAKRWKRRIVKIIRPDLGDCKAAEDAFKKLQEIFHDITDENAFGEDDAK
ncbi:hypothetical protein M4R22_02800 [Acidovorax sp. GBBC 3334]|uniref:hypothetical protein n=1 Tax=Acidovorax sp. GBBC 3334 TaxID=2940496 RepID=UPI002303900C|nr:hypothetical protein [Acidovorax sp. GBBC 3334]MDA8453685.1 hypothetical protein [Acidovorax sp. GBBC 3334]